LLESEVILYGALATRRVRVDGDPVDWQTCVLVSRSAAQGDAVAMSRFLGEQLERGRRLIETARISDDGSSALIEMWEAGIVDTLEAHHRHDLVVRFEASDSLDLWRRVVSQTWRTKARMRRELLVLAEFCDQLRATASSTSVEANVKGHRVLPMGGHRFSPSAAVIVPR
jgi:hypothetical protein